MKTSGEIRRLERIAENTLDENESKAAMLKLRGLNKTYHWCAEWDYMVICDQHNEWKSCLCDLPEGMGRLHRIPVYGTTEGKLYINPEDLFALPKVQKLIQDIANRVKITVTDIEPPKP